MSEEYEENPTNEHYQTLQSDWRDNHYKEERERIEAND